ncbi:hypothetical protein LIER_11462 [Lithospermum erythrorhizon]|uniref:Retrotransposon gag domain-containing protein n=1 Tax=Lithospermum erythrorhizon TaxID=34254 RepID=A0AAV3PPJ0_LITER
MMPQPPKLKTSQYKTDMRKYCQYHKEHGHDTDDCRHLKIEIEKLIQRGQLKEYIHKEIHSVNIRFNRGRIEEGRSPRRQSGGGDSGSARRKYAKRDIYAVTAGARPELPDMSFYKNDFERIAFPHEDSLVITPVIVNFQVGRMLVDTRSSVDILFLDALRLWELKDMSGVDPGVVVHRLYLDPHYNPIKQKNQTFLEDKGEAIREEVNKLLGADVIRELLFPTGLANVVLVPKLNGTLMMCTDFTSINKA